MHICYSNQNQTGPGRAGPGRAGPGRAGPGRAGQGRAGQGRAGQGRAGQGRAGQGRAGPNEIYTQNNHLKSTIVCCMLGLLSVFDCFFSFLLQT